MITFSEFYAVPLDSFLFLRYVVLLTKEAAHMRDMLENLYFGNITPNDQNVRSGTALKKAMEQSAECEEKLTALLEDKEKALLLRLINAENEIGSTMALENFILGFRLGVRMILEALDEDDGSLIDPNHSDIPGGTTLGNISVRHVAVRSADVGIAQLAMHAPYETCGCGDTGDLTALARTLFASSLCETGEETYTIR